jgi:hypothetical protein
MDTFKSILFFFCICFSLNAFADDQVGSNKNDIPLGRYHIDIVLPQDMHWTLFKNVQDTAGYNKIYLPRKADNMSDQNISVSYGVNISTPIDDTMQEVVSVLDKTDCEIADSKVIKKEHNSIVFEVLLDRCANNKSAVQIFKVFDVDEGQYSVFYSADLEKVDESTLQKMKMAIQNSRLTLD